MIEAYEEAKKYISNLKLVVNGMSAKIYIGKRKIFGCSGIDFQMIIKAYMDALTIGYVLSKKTKQLN